MQFYSFSFLVFLVVYATFWILPTWPQKKWLLQPRNNTAYVQGERYFRQLIASINSHCGKVLFVAMPTSGMIREIDEERHPRANFLEMFEKEAGVSVLSSADDPVLRSFACPDRSRLDLRDRQKFIAALVHSLGIGLSPIEATD